MKPEETNTLVKYRLEQAQAALNDAKVLIDTNCTPTSIVNRSYYGMFYAALGLLQTLGKTPSKHTGVLSLFDKEFILPGHLPRHLSRNLHDIFDLRLRLDYRITPVVDSSNALEVWRQASEFVDCVRNYLGNAGYL